jgi:predicted acyltransferase
MTSSNPGRLASIDVFRALTMFLMIFVNDLWTLRDIPEWLEHVPAEVDGLGLADVVFPMFLFIVGLSIPLAINHRLAKGDSKSTILKHTLLRSFALLAMGVFHVNLESYSDAALLPKPLWEILITLGFFLLWLDYPKSYEQKKKYLLQTAGVILLLSMAVVYRGGPVENPEWMTTQWWGILGLIGWSYLICSILYLLFPRRTLVHFVLMVAFLFFSAAEKLQWLDFAKAVRSHFWIVSDGSLPAIVMGGIVATCLYLELKHKNFFIVSVVASFAMILVCFVTRPLWGIHKIDASPSWITLSIGISLLCFAFLVWLVDLKQKENWFKILRPAGTSTLTAYLLPYIHYAILLWTGITLPLFLRTGEIGVFKSLIYAFVIILITGFLEKRKLKLKI